jgi:signal transduction histidine kinase
MAMQGERPQEGITEDTDIHIAGDGTELVVREARSVVSWKGARAEVVIHHDVTEEKRAEERERFLHTLLRHDIANKLQGAYGYLELLKRTGLSQKQEAYMQNLRGSIEDTIELVDKIRQLMTVDERRETTVMNLDIAIRDSIEDLSTRAEEQGIAIEYQGIPGSLVRASPLLTNAFANLIGNSISHGGCRRIRISTSQLEDGYHIAVEDDGKGIPNAVKKDLFKREVRGPESTGSGLGLLLVKRILEASGGTIELKDTEEGTRFDIYLRKAARRDGSTDIPCS